MTRAARYGLLAGVVGALGVVWLRRWWKARAAADADGILIYSNAPLSGNGVL